MLLSNNEVERLLVEVDKKSKDFLIERLDTDIGKELKKATLEQVINLVRRDLVRKTNKVLEVLTDTTSSLDSWTHLNEITSTFELLRSRWYSSRPDEVVTIQARANLSLYLLDDLIVIILLYKEWALGVELTPKSQKLLEEEIKSLKTILFPVWNNLLTNPTILDNNKTLSDYSVAGSFHLLTYTNLRGNKSTWTRIANRSFKNQEFKSADQLLEILQSSEEDIQAALEYYQERTKALLVS